MHTDSTSPPDVSRREFIRNCALGTALLASGTLWGCATVPGKNAARKGAARFVHSLNQDWLFGGKFTDEAVKPDFDDSRFAKITLPHCVTKLSWQDWDAATWADVWIYRRHFDLPSEFDGRRVFLDFAGVMVGASPVINGKALPPHLGAYLPFSYEITDWVLEKNVLAVAIDGRWSDVPPDGNVKGPESVDFSEPAGIPRGVSLRAVPHIFISDVFARPVKVMQADRRVEVLCTIDAGLVPTGPVELKVELKDGRQTIASSSQMVPVPQKTLSTATLTLTELGDVKLWDLENPQLYQVIVTLSVDGKSLHDYQTRIGFREARFEVDGFYLNGRRLQFFGLCRHELYPYVGFAMPDRVMRKDAEILRYELNCNSVRCSHYPQTEAFLDACDELGLLVWEELPGWGYLGDAAWKDQAVRDVQSMILRDRNHPSIIIWGVRINESKNDPELYQRTTAAMKALDNSRPSSGAMVGGLHSLKNWSQDVFAYNDYSHNDKTGKMELKPAVSGVPYFLTEAVGQVVGIGPSTAHIYRRAAAPSLQQKQAIYHAQAHDQAAANPHNSGVIAWCAFEYTSPVIVAYRGVKYPGVYDLFRVPKLGASFYQAQISPQVRPVIQPNFYWDFGPATPQGPGKGVAIFSNCERLEVFVDGQSHASLQPDRTAFPHLKYPPFFADLQMAGDHHPELRIDGYAGGQLLLSQSYSADSSKDQFQLEADAKEVMADGADAVRVVFKVMDKFGMPRALAGGKVDFELSGPGILVGDNPFSLTDAGGAAAVWVKAQPGARGAILLVARHETLGEKTISIRLAPV